MDRQNELKIREIIRLAMQSETPLESDTAMAQFVFEQEPGLVTAWAKEKLVALAKLMMTPKREPDDLQQLLPGLEELPASQRLSLSTKLPLKDGKSGRFGTFSVTQVRETMRLIPKLHAAKLEPMLDFLQEIVNGMSPYSEAYYKRGKPLSVERYCDLKAAGTPVPVVRTPEQRSAIAKKRWAGTSRKERKVIWAKRSAKKRGGE